jgi:hypothetical protein
VDEKPKVKDSVLDFLFVWLPSCDFVWSSRHLIRDLRSHSP